jgi:hypothetical protein
MTVELYPQVDLAHKVDWDSSPREITIYPSSGGNNRTEWISVKQPFAFSLEEVR